MVLLLFLFSTLVSFAQSKPDGTLPVELVYFVGDVADSTGDDPLTEDNWIRYGLAGSGFAPRAENQFILNCNVISSLHVFCCENQILPGVFHRTG